MRLPFNGQYYTNSKDTLATKARVTCLALIVYIVSKFLKCDRSVVPGSFSNLERKEGERRRKKIRIF